MTCECIFNIYIHFNMKSGLYIIIILLILTWKSSRSVLNLSAALYFFCVLFYKDEIERVCSLYSNNKVFYNNVNDYLLVRVHLEMFNLLTLILYWVILSNVYWDRWV